MPAWIRGDRDHDLLPNGDCAYILIQNKNFSAQIAGWGDVKKCLASRQRLSDISAKIAGQPNTI